ncbi:hypothetical protein HGRIS_010956 [Hohenbuehelia grisea]|uniref:Cupredoxin n=1 Tax=Hohenbuehelia grisea TaxID=104357 RepID=A0ABR3IYH6_9AGAR
MSLALALTLSLIPFASAATFDVSVGAGGELAYNPQFVHAAVGDVINFVFHPKNHTVTQSSFDTPCVPLHGGQNSGFMPVAAETTALPNFQFSVTSPDPTWFYCQQTNHCGRGMVFAVNPPAEPNPHSFKAFQDRAIANNGTAAPSASSAASSTATDTYITPPTPEWQTATATITMPSSTWTTIYTSYAGAAAPTPALQPSDHKIIVGADGQLTYSPANISASVGDTVTFEFRSKNHTVTQSSFLNPCLSQAETSLGTQIGFDSGFQPVSAGATSFPTFQIKINDTVPIWGYCRQGDHCVKGMVFSINAVESGPNNSAAFQKLAQRNGTSSPSSAGSGTPTSSSGSSSPSNAAVSISPIRGIGSVLALTATVFMML